MNVSRLFKPLGNLVVAGCLSFAGVCSAGALAQDEELQRLFQELQAQGLSAEEVLVDLVENGYELPFATGYGVGNADSVGLSIAYAQAGICLAPDQAVASVVGQQAVDSASQQARNAVQASVVSTLNIYAEGNCDLLDEQRTNAAQAFAAPTGSNSPNAPAVGAPPEDDTDPPASPSE